MLHNGQDSGNPETPQPWFAPGVVETKTPRNRVKKVPNDNNAIRLVHLLANIGSNSIHLGISSLSLTVASQIQISDIKNSRADDKCSATLQCKLSNLTVT